MESKAYFSGLPPPTLKLNHLQTSDLKILSRTTPQFGAIANHSFHLHLKPPSQWTPFQARCWSLQSCLSWGCSRFPIPPMIATSLRSRSGRPPQSQSSYAGLCCESLTSQAQPQEQIDTRTCRGGCKCRLRRRIPDGGAWLNTKMCSAYWFCLHCNWVEWW